MGKHTPITDESLIRELTPFMMQTPLPSKPVFCLENTHAAIAHAASRLEQAGLCRGRCSTPSGAGVMIGTYADLSLPEGNQRSFRIFEREGKLWFTGDRPRSVLAGVLYYLHHREAGRDFTGPVERVSPYAKRLILEDFPFHCYEPMGFDFDSRTYAENLVALGYTAMECNRYSQQEPLGFHWDAYNYTNPTLAAAIWTRWHEGVWPRELIEANAEELRRCIQTALDFDLEPSVTTFLPRPYPEAFFQKHPQLRGSGSRNIKLIKGNHSTLWRINFDTADGQTFYRDLFAGLMDKHPQIRHMFFWHADLGAGFSADGDEVENQKDGARISRFHHLIDDLLSERKMDTQVWLNPWSMREDAFSDLNRTLPERVGFAVKDNTGTPDVLASIPLTLHDLTIINPRVGRLPERIRALAAASGREVCLGQYQDFSEDLDPILCVPHPILTYRKFDALDAFGPALSSTNWGIISPDRAPNTLNQAVIRERTWGAHTNCFEELAPSLMPADFNLNQRESVLRAWMKIDLALRNWPQFWWLRLQDGGLRFRWLLKPFLLRHDAIPEEDRQYYLQKQSYNIDSNTPFEDQLELEPQQAIEVSRLYGEMVELMAEAEAILNGLQTSASEKSATWLQGQLSSLTWLRLFFTTYRNLLRFHGLPKSDDLSPEHRQCIEAEIENVVETRAHYKRHANALVITRRGSRGMVLGPDVADDFKQKEKLLRAAIE